MKNNLAAAVTENIIFVLEFMGIVIVIFLLAYLAEKLIYKQNNTKEKFFSTRKIAMVGVFSAIAAVLMLFEFPLPFLAPGFYELDFSELPALICSFAFGPVSGILVEFCKILLKLIMKGTTTAFVGDLANFIIGCSFILPASTIYHIKKTKKTAIAACVSATLFMTVLGSLLNAFYLLPTFAQMYGMPLPVILEMGSKINPAINGMTTFVLFAVVPINIIKGTAVSLITILVYKNLSPILKAKV